MKNRKLYRLIIKTNQTKNGFKDEDSFDVIVNLSKLSQSAIMGSMNTACNNTNCVDTKNKACCNDNCTGGSNFGCGQQ